MPKYLAPPEKNWILQLGSLPQQTMSGGFGGAAWLAVAWASAEITENKNNQIAIPQMRTRPIETSLKIIVSSERTKVNW
jgi:hypothetical protein